MENHLDKARAMRKMEELRSEKGVRRALVITTWSTESPDAVCTSNEYQFLKIGNVDGLWEDFCAGTESISNLDSSKYGWPQGFVYCRVDARVGLLQQSHGWQ